jgi:hypothetical protein
MPKLKLKKVEDDKANLEKQDIKHMKLWYSLVVLGSQDIPIAEIGRVAKLVGCCSGCCGPPLRHTYFCYRLPPISAE